MTDDVKAVHVIISGRVQGVWYRGWACEQAKGLGLSGWVRNRRDGTVEAVFAGDTDPVSHMLERCHAGPPAARVSGLEVADADVPATAGFDSLPTV